MISRKRIANSERAARKAALLFASERAPARQAGCFVAAPQTAVRIRSGRGAASSCRCAHPRSSWHDARLTPHDHEPANRNRILPRRVTFLRFRGSKCRSRNRTLSSMVCCLRPSERTPLTSQGEFHVIIIPPPSVRSSRRHRRHRSRAARFRSGSGSPGSRCSSCRRAGADRAVRASAPDLSLQRAGAAHRRQDHGNPP